ncbi:MAG: CvpA family protein [Bacteroidaceae bacterium]|nr:CvpA family protein [Bacteroidaceae bacterium]
MDTIFLIIILVGAIIGFRKGFVCQLASIVGLIAGLLAAKALFIPLSHKIDSSVGSMTFAQILAFLLIWLIVPLIFSLIATILTKALKLMSLNGINRIFGSALGALKYVILVSLFVGILEFVDSGNHLISRTKKTESVLYYPMKSFSSLFFPAAKVITTKLIKK